MKAAFKKGSEIRVGDIKPSVLKPDEIRLDIEACGVCGTDLQDHPGETPREERFGHEMAGTILELGAHVKGLKTGQKVAIDSATPCGRCESCRNARQELCRDIQSFFFTGEFGFAEQANVPAISVIPYEGLSPAVACLQEPLGVALDLVRLADVSPESNVLMMGAGPIGLMALSLVKRAGARRIFVSELGRQKRRVELAAKFGADRCIDPGVTPLAGFNFGCEIDRILVTAPPRTLPDAFAVAAKGAIVSFIGIEHGEGAFCRFDANAFHFKKLQLRASFASPALFGARALQLLREGVIDGEALVSHRFPLDRIADAMRTARSDPSAVKVVVEP